MRLQTRCPWTGVLPVIATLLQCCAASAATYNNQTLTGTVLLPALPFPQTHSFLNTITLNSATVELEGYLRNEQIASCWSQGMHHISRLLCAH